jgi:hypothetical protein
MIEYLKEQLDKLDKSISFNEYVSEQVDRNINFSEYLAEVYSKNIKRKKKIKNLFK